MTWTYESVNEAYQVIDNAVPDTHQFGELDVEVVWFDETEDRWAGLIRGNNEYILFVEGEGAVKRFKQNSKDNAEGLARSELQSY